MTGSRRSLATGRHHMRSLVTGRRAPWAVEAPAPGDTRESRGEYASRRSGCVPTASQVLWDRCVFPRVWEA